MSGGLAPGWKHIGEDVFDRSGYITARAQGPHTAAKIVRAVNSRHELIGLCKRIAATYRHPIAEGYVGCMWCHHQFDTMGGEHHEGDCIVPSALALAKGEEE